MTTFRLAETQLIEFVLVDSDGVEVAGLGANFTVEISKNGADFVAGVGVKNEIGSGWYSYQLTVIETDTQGPLGVRAFGAGTIQQNLIYEVSGSAWSAPAGPNILSVAEAAAILKCAEDDPSMLLLLAQIDDKIKFGSGRNWAAEAIIPQAAKWVARILLVRWHENPGMMSDSADETLGGSYLSGMSQLRAMANYYFTFEGLAGAGSIPLNGVSVGDLVISLVGKVGISGDQSGKFESVITWDGSIQQTSSEDLSLKWFTAYLVPPGEMP